MRIKNLLLVGVGAMALTLVACDKNDAAGKKGDKKAATEKKSDDKKAAADDKKPAADDKKPAVDDKKPAADDKAKMKGHDMGAAKKEGGMNHDMATAAGTVTAGAHGKALLAAYEKVRVALAKDDWETTKTAATALGKWATENAGKVAPTLKPHLEGIVAGAAKMVTAKDIEASRAAPFGEVSKHTISVVVMAKDLGEGVQVYRCPMAKTYKKWLQLDANMANPYMGKRMLKCGGKVKTEV